MRLSELIRLLEGVHRREGDLEVVTREHCTVIDAVRSASTVHVDKLSRKGGRQRFDVIDNRDSNTSAERVVRIS